MQIARERKDNGLDPLDFAEANEMKSCGMKNDLFPGEDGILVEDLLTSSSCDDAVGKCGGYFKTLSGTWMPFEFLLGKDPCSIE